MKSKRSPKKESPLEWLPIDSRIIPSLFSFGSVRGAAKVFLAIEMTLAVGVVAGTLTLLLMRIGAR